MLTRQTRNIGPALAQLRVQWPNIVPYMGIHWANFPGLSGSHHALRNITQDHMSIKKNSNKFLNFTLKISYELFFIIGSQLQRRDFPIMCI